MLKRMNKITSLLVAAAAIVSIMPATGVNAAERLGTKDGTIEKAIAFKDGKYIFEGYKTDDDDKAIYYNDNSDKDKQLDDIEDADIESAYGDKYAYVKDGDDEYLVDLSNGDVSDDETPDDKAENVETKLKSTLKKTDRYDDGTTVAAVKIGGITFGDNWYQYAATPSGDGTEDVVNTTITTRDDGTETGDFLFGFSSESGKYVDASRTANIYAYSSTKDKVVKIKEYNDFDDDANLGVRLTKQPEVLTQDDDYIYALVDVEVTTTSEADFEAGTNGVSAKYIQKISKAQGDKKDGAYLPKSVDSYMLDNKSLYDNGDAEDAYSIIIDGLDGYSAADNQYRVKNNKLYVTAVKDGEVKVYILNMKKVKEDAVASVNTDKKLDGYLVVKDDDADHDIVDTDDNDGKAAVSIDVDGNTWALDKGVILKFDGSDWKEMYTCDRSLNALNVYDENSLVAYEEDGDVYTTVQEGSAATDEESTPAQTGWVNTDKGWTFYDAAGKQVVGSWVNAGGVWYMIKADGIMATGWYNDNGTWYYLNASGAMQTGWFIDGSTWYYLQSSGAMKTGWLNDNGTWYYLNASGAMLANTTVDGYVLGASGAWIK